MHATITNSFEITAVEVAFLYKKHWGIELLLKKMKQYFRFQYFYGENEYALFMGYSEEKLTT